MTIREELEILGPERVRRAMLAFEFGQCGGCFLDHAMRRAGDDWTVLRRWEGRQLLTGDSMGRSLVEASYEGWINHSRAELHAECVAYLAEHGTAPEVAPVSLETVGQPTREEAFQ